MAMTKFTRNFLLSDRFGLRVDRKKPDTPSAPAAPDPAAVAQAEALANRVNVTTPTGSLFFGQPNDSATVTETGPLANIRVGRQAATQRLVDIANNRIPFLGSAPTSFGGLGLENIQSVGNLPQGGADAAFERVRTRLEPEFERRQESLDQSLANQGLPIGSEAFQDAQGTEREAQLRQLTDASRAAETQGFNEALARDAQQFGQGSQRFQQGLQRRQQNVSEAEAIRARQFSELASLLGGQQVTPAGTLNQPGISQVDVQGPIQNDFLARQNQFNQQNANNRQTAGALGGLGGSALSFALPKIFGVPV